MSWNDSEDRTKGGRKGREEEADAKMKRKQKDEDSEQDTEKWNTERQMKIVAWKKLKKERGMITELRDGREKKV